METRFAYTLWVMLLAVLAFGQNPVPNAGFEYWTDNLPQDWKTSNLASGHGDNVTPVSPGFSGDWAVRGEVIRYPNVPLFPHPPLLISAYETGGFPLEQSFSKASLYYRYQPASTEDALGVFVGVMDATGQSIGGGFVEVYTPADEFKPLEIPVTYDDAFVPVKAIISITIYNHGESGLPSIGTYFEIDDISLGDLVSSVDTPQLPNVGLNRVFPNPADSEVIIAFELTQKQTLNLELFDLTGRKISQTFSGQLERGEHQIPIDVSQLPNGLYLCRLSTVHGSITQKIRVSRS